ncbi:efflux RND transporter permease subunit [Agreia pratensis]|uniref:Hydrophobic/amphiphilic exporter-1, HAE1 family n=1 Tax=Agreia pratensis TaxID=150121 RepID=A0A1X7JN82_9MICO|nr:efflux RND transporter permease subunit [Agreia pratensis]SMG28895.1 hydrophobic/amphiphilic exporter-1, HAE1 family [Agreia pratensis]
MHFLAILSMKNRALIALVTIVAAVFGGLALTSLKQELIPSIEFPQLAVLTNYPGASPEVVNDDVSVPIETAIQGVAGIETTTATSSTNLSIISATFTYGTNLATAEQKINQAINRIKSSLPEDLDPQVLSGGIDDFPVVQIAVTPADGTTDTKALAALLRANTLPDITDVAGVRDAQLVGDIGQRVTITPDPAKLASAGLSTQAIRDAVKNNGLLIPAGSLTENDKTLSVQAGTKLTSVADIQGLPLGGAPKPEGGVYTIADVASVALTDNPVTSISRVDGKPALTIAITKLPAANTVEVSNAVQDLLPKLKTALDGATFTVVFDQAPYIQQSIQALTEEGLLGLFFAVVVILVFLLSIRSTLVTAISIPTSLLITFIGLQTAGYSLNILTLGALTIAIGRVVDDSIVVIENIRRHLASPEGVARMQGGTDRAGAARAAIIVEAVREVAGAITASTITTVAVFLPISFVEGTTGELFRPFALTVTIALLASLIVALTIVPVLAYWFLRSRKTKTHAHDIASAPVVPVDAATGLESRRARRQEQLVIEEEKPSALQKRYLPILEGTLKRPVITLVSATLLLLLTLGLTPFMKTNFLGSSGQNTLTVTQTVPVGTSLDAQNTAAQSVEKALLGIKGITTVQLSIGSSGSALRDAFVGGGAGAITYSITTDESADQDALAETVRTTLEKTSDAGDIQVAASAGFGTSSDIAIDVTATSAADLQTASDAILAKVSKLDAITQSESNLSNSRPYIAVTVDRVKATEAGLSETVVGGIVSQAMQPQTLGTIFIDDTSYTMYIQSQTSPATVADLAGLQIPSAAGLVRLDSVAKVETVDGPASITTVKGVRTATITATPASDNLGTASAEVQAAVNDTKLPAGATATLGGVTSDQGDAFSQLGIALLVAILIVYVVMVATFRSLLQPLLLLVSVPFAATGAIILQLVSGIPLGVPSIIGVLMLIGIVVTNAIVLIDLVNQYREKGRSVREALIDGASRRLRPILMTALATIFALLPMAVGLTGHGGFISQPLALVVIGGLVSSTVLTLLVLPVLYSVVYGALERRKARRIEREEGRVA